MHGGYGSMYVAFSLCLACMQYFFVYVMFLGNVCERRDLEVSSNSYFKA